MICLTYVRDIELAALCKQANKPKSYYIYKRKKLEVLNHRTSSEIEYLSSQNW